MTYHKQASGQNLNDTRSQHDQTDSTLSDFDSEHKVRWRRNKSIINFFSNTFISSETPVDSVEQTSSSGKDSNDETNICFYDSN